MSDSPNRINGHELNVGPDIPDIRDWPYQPSLIEIKQEIDPPVNQPILDQGQEGACVGFALAGVINVLNQQRRNPTQVSARMLYEMAKRHDEWEGERYSGSSCRGGIKGWHHTGVCTEAEWPYAVNRKGRLTVKRAKAARKNTIGAYYRLRHRISDFHTAINEAHVLFASANVHAGWDNENIKDGVIPHRATLEGGHAFAIVGYNEAGFWVQNSWGPDWGQRGLALWTYEDWHENITDAWVLRLALSTPQVWHRADELKQGTATIHGYSISPNRSRIAGHFVHIDDGQFDPFGKYWSDDTDVAETAEHLRENVKGYRHLLFYAHGGLNKPEASACRILKMKDVYKENKIYPYHFMYDTGLREELKDVVFGKRNETTQRVGAMSDMSDWLVEKAARLPGRALWREMKSGAQSPFHKRNAGTKTLELMARAISEQPASKRCKIHLVGHSTGAIFIAHLLERLKQIGKIKRVASVSLMAPAATIDLYEDIYQPLLTARQSQFGIDQLCIYNLTDRLERDDTVTMVYRKSLLYLVSRAFEEKRKAPLLGMEKYSEELEPHKRLTIHYSDGRAFQTAKTRSETHGGFDNDPNTMNSILRTVLSKRPRRLFTCEDLDY
ncbi:C1 family peptidase [Phycisphaeraceae bacterium D3-23]